MIAHRLLAVSLLASLTACGGGITSGANPAAGTLGQSSMRGAASGGTIAWNPTSLTLSGPRPKYSTLGFTAGDTYTEANTCGSAVIRQRVTEENRKNITYFHFEYIKNAPPLTCTITETLVGSPTAPSATLTITIKK